MKRYFHPRVLAVLLLGFSSGLPRALVGGTLAAWLAKGGVDKAAIGLFAYVATPYAFKFAWAPLMDQVPLPGLGRRLGQRVGWMVLTQACLMVMLAGMAALNPAMTPEATALMALLVAFFSASQDVVIDAYRAEYLHKDQYGEGAAVAVFGYRVGMLVSGAGALILADILSRGEAYDFSAWSVVYLIMAALMLPGMITALIAGEPQIERMTAAQDGGWMERAVIAPFREFAAAHRAWIVLLLFVASYRVADGFIGFMTTPFFIETGFSTAEIGSVAKLYGFAAAIAGAFLGGGLLRRLGMWRALLWFGLAQLLSNLIYLLLPATGAQLWALMVVISVENLAGGAVGAVAVAFLMRLCDPRYTATQYALLSSLAALAGTLLAGAAGWVADVYGWPAMFLLSALLGLPALALLAPLRRHPLLQGDDELMESS